MLMLMSFLGSLIRGFKVWGLGPMGEGLGFRANP